MDRDATTKFQAELVLNQQRLRIFRKTDAAALLVETLTPNRRGKEAVWSEIPNQGNFTLRP